MIELKQKNIDGVDYEFLPLMATPARNMLDQLINKFGPAIAKGLEGLKDAGEFSGDDDVSALVPALSGSLGAALDSFSTAITAGFHKNIVDTFLNKVNVVEPDGNKPQLTAADREIRFATNLLTETKVLLWCLEEQYGDFFGLFRRVGIQTAANMAIKTPSKSNSLKDSTGTFKG